MKITIEKECKTVEEILKFVSGMVPKTKVFVDRPERIRLFTPAKAAKLISPPVRNYDANKEILNYVRAAGRKGRTTEDMARDLANLGAGKNRFYFAQKAYDLLSHRRLARFTGENGQYIYVMPYHRKGGMMVSKPKPKPAPKPVRVVRKYSQSGNSAYKEVEAATQLILEDRKSRGALFPEIRDLVAPSLKQHSPNYASAVVSFLKKKKIIVAREERVDGQPSIKFRYYLPEYAPQVL